MDDLRYPIGKFQYVAGAPPEQLSQWVAEIAAAPAGFRAAIAGLSPAQLDTPYRPGGWTVRQVAHHVPDSHINAYMRYRLALTEDAPPIKAYKEDRWAELTDAREAPVEVSLALLEALHERWTLLLRSLTPDQWGRAFLHPERGLARLDADAGLYAWHGRHHIAHITSLRKRMGWD
jgi:hypothetical protein